MRVSTLTVTPYQRRHLQAIRDLLFHSNFVHTHLDWHESDQWLETVESITRLAWQSGRLVGVLGLSKPLNQTSWIRIASVLDYVEPETVIRSLWENVLLELRAQAVHTVGLLVINEWIAHYVPALGFVYDENIITLSRSSFDLPEPLPNAPVIRVGELHDLPRLAEVDQAAFDPPWQMAYEDIRQAYRMASSCTLATVDNAIIGFQISTLFFDGAHLARLAVHPAAQGRGAGRALLADLIERFQRRGAYMMSVNTQASNHHARNLYTAFRLVPSGFDLPYWSAKL